jgi:hypothetical protein
VLPWVADADLPIPIYPELIAMARTSALTTMVMSLIDGTHSISDIAASLAGRLGVDRDDLKGQLRDFFGKLPVA